MTRCHRLHRSLLLRLSWYEHIAEFAPHKRVADASRWQRHDLASARRGAKGCHRLQESGGSPRFSFLTARIRVSIRVEWSSRAGAVHATGNENAIALAAGAGWIKSRCSSVSRTAVAVAVPVTVGVARCLEVLHEPARGENASFRSESARGFFGTTLLSSSPGRYKADLDSHWQNTYPTDESVRNHGMLRASRCPQPAGRRGGKISEEDSAKARYLSSTTG